MREMIETFLLFVLGVLVGGGILMWVHNHVKCWNIFGNVSCIVW